MVGERGPEMFVPHSAGRVVSNQGAFAGGTTAVELHLSPDVEARVLRRAEGQAVRVVRAAGPAIASQGAQSARENYARSGGWTTL